jgi:uncharacterized membrane protein
MDRAKDAGIGWRRNTRWGMNHLGVQWLDPTRKPIDVGVEDDASRELRKKCKREGNLGPVVDEMKPIRRVDLRMVDICDFLIVNLDMDIHACGTYEEIFLANRQKKPILIHVEQGRNAVPDWLLGTVPEEYIFDNWKDLYDYLDRVNGDPEWVDTHGRWYFFHWMGAYELEGPQQVEFVYAAAPRSTPLRTLVKSVGWESFSFVLTLLISWIVTQSWGEATELTVALFVLKVMFLFLYERVWQRILWGKNHGTLQDREV